MTRTFAAHVLVMMCAALALASSAACTSGESSDSPASPPETRTGANTNGTLTNADGWPRVEGLRGKRYCEVLLARAVDGHLVAEVWNSFGLNDCPEAEWKALDAAAIKTEREVLFVLLNGPRYWLMDAIEKKPDGAREETVFGALAMFRAASVDLGPIPPNLAPFTERRVARDTVFEFAGGGEIYELTSTDGKVYVMQSYNEQGDASLTEDDLPGLARRLTLPPGWTYAARSLDGTLRVLTPGAEAAVIQDNLSNTYQLIEPN